LRIIITGGCGFIGFALAKRLLEKANGNDEIILLDNLKRHGLLPEIAHFYSHPNVKFINIDLSNPHTLKDVPSPVDRVYHLAAIVGVGPIMKNSSDVLRINTLSTLNIFEWFVNNSNKDARLIFSSSSEVYSGNVLAGFEMPIPTPENIPVVISDLDNHRFSYAISKIWGESYAKSISREKHIHLASVRYHNVYGPSMGFDHVIPNIVSRVVRKENPFKMISSEQTRSFCWIEDAVKATHLIMESDKLEPGMTIHVGDQNGETKIGKLYELIFDLCEWRPGKIKEIDPPKGSVSRRCPDTSLMERLTGFKPETSLNEGLQKTVEWYMENTK